MAAARVLREGGLQVGEIEQSLAVALEDERDESIAEHAGPVDEHDGFSGRRRVDQFGRDDGGRERIRQGPPRIAPAPARHGARRTALRVDSWFATGSSCVY